jgi:hypothetical protein
MFSIVRLSGILFFGKSICDGGLEIFFDSWGAQLSTYASQEHSSVTQKFVTMRVHGKATEEAAVEINFQQPVNAATSSSLLEKAFSSKTKHLQQKVDHLQQSARNHSTTVLLLIPSNNREASPARALKKMAETKKKSPPRGEKGISAVSPTMLPSPPRNLQPTQNLERRNRVPSKAPQRKMQNLR